LIPHPAASDSTLAPDGDRHARLVSLVEQMLGLHKRLHAPRTSASDRAIDRLGDDLYGLTDEEIRIVEESARK
jgi:hypothetical protein